MSKSNIIHTHTTPSEAAGVVVRLLRKMGIASADQLVAWSADPMARKPGAYTDRLFIVQRALAINVGARTVRAVEGRYVAA